MAPYLLRSPEAPCFVSKRTGRGDNINAYRLAFVRACKKAEIAKSTPHQFRHTCYNMDPASGRTSWGSKP